MSSRETRMSVDEMLQQATCAILDERHGRVTAVATAWLCSDGGHLVTAGHTFFGQGKQAVAIGDQVSVQFLDEQPVAAILRRAVFEQDMGIDFAILKLVDPPKDRTPLRFMLVREVEGTFSLRGYGSSLPNSQSGGQGAFGMSNIRSYSSGNVLFQLHSPELAYEGFSGGAVYSTQLQAVVAIQTEAKLGTATILAMPLYRAVEHWERMEELAALPGTCFVIAPRDRLDRLADEIVRPVVSEELGYEVKVSQPGRVDADDLSQIEQAELIVVDVTGRDPSVIYELAAGHGAGIPDIILGEAASAADYGKLPFSVTQIAIEDLDQAKEQFRSKLQALKVAISALESTPTNVITKALRSPLTQISPAYGLALGHFYNFVKQVGDALRLAARDDRIIIEVGGEEIKDQQRRAAIKLTIAIPKRLEWADHEFINDQVRDLTVDASVSLLSRPRPFTLWALKRDKAQDVELVDIFPTAMGVIARAIDQRMGITDPGLRHTIAWRELENKEIARFSSSLLSLIHADAKLSKRVRVRSWRSVFPELESHYG